MTDDVRHRGDRNVRRSGRRLRRRLRRRARRLWRFARRYAALAGLVAIAAIAWATWSVVRAENALAAVDSDAQLVSAAVASSNPDAVHASFAHLKLDAAASERRTSGPVWWVLEHLPWVGDNARGVRVLATVASHLSSGPVEQLAARADDVNRVMPSGGRVDLAAVHALAPLIASSRPAVDTARQQLDHQSSGSLLAPLRGPYERLRTRVDELSGVLGAADVAARVMPQMLAEGGPDRHYILVLQNNAEIRSSGGLPGAVSEIVTHRGRLSITRQTSGADFLPTSAPVLPLSQVEQALYGPKLGNWFVDANFVPDFPRTAELMRAHWQQTLGGHIDGVISVDPVALSYVLSAIGPVRVDGVQLGADNVVDELLHDTYLRLDGASQDAFFRDATKTIFNALIAGAVRPGPVAAALARGVAEHRLLLHDFAPSVQAVIDSTPLAGDLLRDAPTHPQIGVYFNDATGAKMSYYLRYQASVTPQSCSDGRQQLGAALTIGSQAPANAATLPIWVTGGGRYGVAPGDQVVALRIYGPVGGSIEGLTVDGTRPVEEQAFDADGRPVTKVWAALAPGQTHQLAWTMTTGPGQTGSTYFAMTPSVQPGRSSGVIASACG